VDLGEGAVRDGSEVHRERARRNEVLEMICAFGILEMIRTGDSEGLS
jgi:acetolactate synthase small subunit